MIFSFLYLIIKIKARFLVIHNGTIKIKESLNTLLEVCRLIFRPLSLTLRLNVNLWIGYIALLFLSKLGNLTALGIVELVEFLVLFIQSGVFAQILVIYLEEY
jgi:F0F1-type ATP synthase membrane subunit a